MRSTTLIFYILLVFYVCFLFNIFFVQALGVDRTTYFLEGEDHLVPFHTTTEMIRKAKREGFRSQAGIVMVKNIGGNLLLFVPLGLMLPFLNRFFNNWKIIGLAGLFLSTLIEITQLVFQLGIFDIDDIIYNTTGMLLGYGVVKIVQQLFEKPEGRMLKSSDRMLYTNK